jgi:choline dehydrogenase-like flavoprotein
MADHPAHPQPRSQTPGNGVTYRPAEEVDFAIVGSGAAGGVMARELAGAGFSVVVLEQGPWLTAADFKHDELWMLDSSLTNDHKKSPNTVRTTASQTARVKPAVKYGRVVGGGSVHFTANYWRFHPIDFVERSTRGPIAGTSFDDWPITYDELEPYYTKVDWEIGVSGVAQANPFDPPRSKPYPMPPLPIKSTGVLMERGAKKLGWHAAPAPMAIATIPYRGRGACIHCGFCEMFGCEMGAKSSTLVAMIPDAVATGRCEIRPNSYVRKIETNAAGRVTGVVYFDAGKREVVQRARAVVLCANGAETPRLLLLSKSSRFPHGLANSSGIVGTNIMFNGGAIGGALFDHEINGYKGAVVSRIVHDFYELGEAVGAVGGGGIDFRLDLPPIMFALQGLDPKAPRWGSEYKNLLRRWFTHSLYGFGHTTSLPVPTNGVTLDPHVRDAWGLPAIRMTFTRHENDRKVMEFFGARVTELLDAAGGHSTWMTPIDAESYPEFHLLGTCRMGNDPRTSVVDKYHRAHDVPNLFIVDGSSFVTSGRGQPTMTIQALAFRAGEHIAAAAKRGEI